MKKAFRKISFVLIIGLMCFFIINNFNKKSDKTVDAAVDNSKVTINLINSNPNYGNVYYSIFDGSDYKGKYESGTSIVAGTKIKMYYEPNDDLKMTYFWANSNGATYTVTEGYDKSYFVKTVLKDLTVYIGAMTDNDHLVTYYETSSTELAGIIGFSIVADGQEADTSNVIVPHRRGFDFKYFSEDLTNVTKDMIVYPVYNSNIFSIFRDYWTLFAKGLGITILLAVISIALSLVLGASLCLGKISKNKPLSIICSSYIELIRGIPSLLLLLLIYCIVGPTRIHIGSFFSTEVISCILALFLNSSAYTAEIFRSGIQAVDVGQTEAGRALGLSNWQVLSKIVIPQGLKNALPSLGNELVMIIKETSLAYSVNSAIGELMSAKVTITSITGDSLSPYIIIAIIYFIVTFSLSRLIMYLEKRLAN